jgi:hypothetical protein
MNEREHEVFPCTMLYDGLASVLAEQAGTFECDDVLQPIDSDTLEGDLLQVWLVEKLDFREPAQPSFLVFIRLYDKPDQHGSNIDPSNQNNVLSPKLVGHTLNEDSIEKYEHLIEAMARVDGRDCDEVREDMENGIADCGSYCILALPDQAPIIVNTYFHDDYFDAIKAGSGGKAPNDKEVITDLLKKGIARRLTEGECKAYLMHIETAQPPEPTRFLDDL